MNIRRELYISYEPLMNTAEYFAGNNPEYKGKLDKLIQKQQDIWESGDTVLGKNINMLNAFNWPKRKPEEEQEEREKHLKDTTNLVFDTVVEQWMSLTPRDQVVQAMRFCTCLDRDIRFCLFDKFTISAMDMIKVWNKMHPDEEPIFVVPEIDP